ncbi:MAG: transposase [Candidatus Competibacteraceae bacterium]|nr:transposase [Candidatus Competibacteraceae bacterium]
MIPIDPQALMLNDENCGSLVFQGVLKHNSINQLPTSSENSMTDKSLDELKSAFNVLLDIPHIKIDEVEIDREGNDRVTIQSTEHGTHCYQCGHFIEHFYGQGEFITLRHLALFGRQVELRLRPPRYSCQRCQGQPTTTQRATWYNHRSRCTQACEKQVLLAWINSTVWDVRIKEGMGYEAVRGIIDRSIAKGVDWQAIKHLKIMVLRGVLWRRSLKDGW